MIGASLEPVVSSTKVERHTPDTRPSSEEAHPYRSPTDRGKERQGIRQDIVLALNGLTGQD